KNAPPTGRRANATAKIAKVCSNATAPCDSGKNVLAMIVAIKPYTAISNHSTTVPAKPANVTWRSIFGDTSAVGDWFSMGVESLAFMKDSNVGETRGHSLFGRTTLEVSNTHGLVEAENTGFDTPMRFNQPSSVSERLAADLLFGWQRSGWYGVFEVW